MNQAETILFGSYRLIVPAGPLLCGHDEVALRPKTMEVLCYLAMHAGELVSKEALLRTLWPQLVVNEGGLAICIREIRQALGDDSRTPQYIQTVHRRGYRFIAGLNAPGSNSADSLSGSASATRSAAARTLGWRAASPADTTGWWSTMPPRTPKRAPTASLRPSTDRRATRLS